MTREAIEQMLEVSRHVKAIDIEDVLFTGILREKGKIHLKDINIHIVSNEKVYSLLKRFEKVKNIVHFWRDQNMFTKRLKNYRKRCSISYYFSK